MKNTNTKANSPRSPKKTYNSPHLICYGTVRALTQGGPTGPNEMATMMSNEMVASDRMLKEDIVRIGEHPLGIGLYLFNYKSNYREQLGSDRQFGVMANEVETVMPAAVSKHPDGYKMVNYAMLGINRAV
jgi:hypothetical protein